MKRYIVIGVINIELLSYLIIDNIMEMYKEKGYSDKQISQIRRGIEDNIDISQYDNINISPDEMFGIRWKLVIEKINGGNDSHEC